MLPCTHASKGKLAFNLKRQEVTSPSQPPAQAALTATPPLTYHLSSTLLLATCGESFALLNVSEYEQPAINRGGRSYVRCMVKASPYSPLISLSHIYIILITSTSFFFPLHSPVEPSRSTYGNAGRDSAFRPHVRLGNKDILQRRVRRHAEALYIDVAAMPSSKLRTVVSIT